MSELQHTEASVTHLLQTRHEKDVFVAGCALGSRQRGVKELDGWALLRSWSPVTTIGYEIKVSRSDWLRDQKVHLYQRAVHLMYVVAPKGIVQAAELSAGCGLLEVTSGGGRLLTRVKPVRHEHPENEGLLLYILMSRAQIVGDMWEANKRQGEANLAFWQKVLEGRVARHILGHAVSKKVGEELRQAENAARNAQFERDLLKPVAKAIGELLDLPVEEVLCMGSFEIVQRLRERQGQCVSPDVAEMMLRARRLHKLASDVVEGLGNVLEGEPGEKEVAGP